MAETTQEQRQTLAIYIEKHAALQVTIPAALAIGLLRDLDAAEAEARGLSAMLDGVNGVLKQVEAERDDLRELVSKIERWAFQQKVWGGVDGYILHPMSSVCQAKIREALVKWREEWK